TATQTRTRRLQPERLESHSGVRLLRAAHPWRDRFRAVAMGRDRARCSDERIHVADRTGSRGQGRGSLETAYRENRPAGFGEVFVTLPLKTSYAPMEADPAAELPEGKEWQYEPKWDGFRCLAFRDGAKIELESKSQKSLTRYFPELANAIRKLNVSKFVLDGEIVIAVNGKLSFDNLLMRIHPAESRVQKLSQEEPALYVVFDLLVDEQGKSKVTRSLTERRQLLEKFTA